MLGQPVSMLIPRVVGFKLTGSIPAGATATDVVLTITEMLRKHGVVGKFVEFYGEGVAAGAAGQPRHHRQHEPRVRLDLRDLPDRRRHARLPAPHRPLRRAGRARRGVRQGAGPLATTPTSRSRASASTSSSTCPRSSRRSPARSARRTASSLTDAKEAFRKVLPTYVAHDEGDAGRGVELPGQRPHPAGQPRRHQRRHAAADEGDGNGLATVEARCRSPPPRERRSRSTTASSRSPRSRSCTNTSNPSVMMAAALLAKNAVEKGLTVEPWVKTSMAPGLQGRHRLLREGRHVALPREARLPPRRLRLHDLHRQLRPAQRGDLRRRSTTTTSPSSRCSRATATSRAGSTPT